MESRGLSGNQQLENLLHWSLEVVINLDRKVPAIEARPPGLDPVPPLGSRFWAKNEKIQIHQENPGFYIQADTSELWKRVEVH